MISHQEWDQYTEKQKIDYQFDHSIRMERDLERLSAAIDDYENNYGGAVNRLNAITAQLAELDFVKAPGFVINGLKREELIASNSMILHELFFASLGGESMPEGELRDSLARDFGSVDRWRAEFS